jgi:hypothetical protein
MTPHFDLVILIDCWPATDEWLTVNVHKELNKFYERIVNRLSTYDFKNVALATYTIPNTERDTYTSSVILDNIRSNNYNNAHLKIRRCENMVDIFREFPEACQTGLGKYNNAKSVNILICGQSWQVCTHWRPLGFIPWIMQGQTVFTHPDLVWQLGGPLFDQFVFEYDPRIIWNKLHSDSYESHSVGTGKDYIESPFFWSRELKWDFANEEPPTASYFYRET